MSRSYPLANRIIAEHAGQRMVDAGELVTVSVDRVYIQDGNSPTIARLFAEHGLNRVFDPERVGFFFDHSVVVPERQMADRLREAAAFASQLGAQIFSRGVGISHVVALEEGWFRPGDIVLGADSHTCTGGAVQALALGMGATDIAAAMVTGSTWLKVPETVWLKVEGSPHPATRAKDVVLHAMRTFGESTFLYRSVEWCGEWAERLSLDAAASAASMGVELGAKCVFFPDGPGRPAGMSSIIPGEERNVLHLSVDGLGPLIALPHSPSNVAPLNEAAGTKIDYVFVGSCTNSRLEDITDFVGALQGRAIHPSVHCILTPGSKSVYLEAMSLGYIDKLVRAGVLVSPPGCGPCVGTQGTIPASGDKVLTTMNRNFKGRMGNPDAEIYLSSPIVAANTALLGHVPSLEELTWNV